MTPAPVHTTSWSVHFITLSTRPKTSSWAKRICGVAYRKKGVEPSQIPPEVSEKIIRWVDGSGVAIIKIVVSPLWEAA